MWTFNDESSECPNCKWNNCYRISETKNPELSMFCKDCWYYYYWEFKRNKDGSFMVKNNTLPKDKLYEFQNLIFEEISCIKPIWYLYFKTEDSEYTYSIDWEWDIETYATEIVNVIKKNWPNYIKELNFSLWSIDGTFIKYNEVQSFLNYATEFYKQLDTSPFKKDIIEYSKKNRNKEFCYYIQPYKALPCSAEIFMINWIIADLWDFWKCCWTSDWNYWCDNMTFYINKDNKSWLLKKYNINEEQLKEINNKLIEKFNIWCCWMCS